jgi:hypothetical protein
MTDLDIRIVISTNKHSAAAAANLIDHATVFEPVRLFRAVAITLANFGARC